MDARLHAKLEERCTKDGFLRKKDRETAIAERFEEVVQELIESTGMKYEAKPEINNKILDGMICHKNGRVYIEAVCAQGPDEFNDERGEVDLCRMMSPKLIEENICVILSYKTTAKDEWGYDKVHTAKELKNPISNANANYLLTQIQAMTSEQPDEHGDWTSEIEIRERRLSAFVSRYSGKLGQSHIGHSECAVGFIKDASKGGHVSDRYKSDRKRIVRKIRKYRPSTLDGWPLIVALGSKDAWTHEETAKIAYGTTLESVSLAQNPESRKMVTTGTQTILMRDGIWSDTQGNHRMNLAAIWIFDSWDTANELPLLAINPFLEDEEIDRAIPKRMMDVSMICRPRPDGKVFT